MVVIVDNHCIIEEIPARESVHHKKLKKMATAKDRSCSSALVAVLGDISYSPRMLNHISELLSLKSMKRIHVIAYQGSCSLVVFKESLL